MHHFDGFLRSVGTISVNGRNKFIPVYKRVIDAPGVYRKAFDLAIAKKAQSDTFDDLGEKSINIPSEFAVRNVDLIFKTIDLVKKDTRFAFVAYDVPAARGTYINCKIMFPFHDYIIT